MTRKQIPTAVAFLAFASISFCATIADGQQFDLSWYTIDGGGGCAAGGNFELEGTIGQHDAGPDMTGGGYQLTGGFWAGGGNQGPVQTVADSINIFRGLLIGGVLEDTFASDDSRMRFNPGLTLSSNEAPVWLIFDAALPSDNPGSLSLVMESNAGTPGLTHTLEAWNWMSAAYDVFDVSSASFNNDVVVTVDLSSGIANYVQVTSSAVRTRVGWRKTGLTLNFPWEVRVDQIVWISE